ncbi:MAG: nucleotide sugar dehydrogenase [Woeseiaceae bacterium]|nr:nucleotide sugar dehydrogenase [Woeseiaceae bacterium]
MPLKLDNGQCAEWSVRKIGVIGPGIVGMPMAALLADARLKEGSDEPAKVVVVQRNSKTSGWKVDAINEGRSVIGGVEPGLDKIVNETVAEGILSASHDYSVLSDADVVLVSVQTDKKGVDPDYGPLFGALEHLAEALSKKPEGNIPIVCFESTLAPSSMATVVREHFAKYGLEEGKDILLGNSPNRVMPGRLVERVASADKLVAGLHPVTPQLISKLYSRIVTNGELHQTNSMTAEVVKTLENAYRDVRIAFATEIVRYCDANDISFYAVRDAVNERIAQSDDASASATAVPIGGILVPMIGVGGHCLPKDGVLLWWRKIRSGADTSNSLILNSREINDDSPAETIAMAEKKIGSVDGKKIALLGTAYRFDSEDTRNSPTLATARLLLDKGCDITIHDPYVKKSDQNLERFELTEYFTNDLGEALADAEVVVFCTGHGVYQHGLDDILKRAPNLQAIVDGANLYNESDIDGPVYVGIGRGSQPPSEEFLDFVEQSFRVMEHGTANEVQALIDFLNVNYSNSEFNNVELSVVQRLGSTCATGCDIADTKSPLDAPSYDGFSCVLTQCASREAMEK